MIESLIDPKMKKIQKESGDPSGYQIFDSIRPGKQDRIFSHIARVYFPCGRNALRSAETLHIHKSTFFYRMNKIAGITWRTDRRTVISDEISLRLLKLSGDKSGNSNTTGK